MQRTIRAAMAATVLTIGVFAPAQAVPELQVHFEAARDNCVEGTANLDFTLQLRNASNHVVDETPVVRQPDDTWFDCLSRAVRPGDRLRATAGSQTVLFRIPTFSLRIDRVGDVLKGNLGHQFQLRLRVRHCNGFADDCPVVVTRTVSGDLAGHYHKDLTSAFDIRGLDKVEARYTDGAGNHYTIRQYVPVFVVEEGEKELGGSLQHGQDSVMKLLSQPGGTVLSSKLAVPEINSDQFHVTFSKAMRAPRQVIADFATDAKMTIPDMTVTYSSSGGHDFLRTRCLPNRRTRVQWDTGEAFVVASSTGRVIIDLTNEGSVAPVTVHDVRCASKAGDLLIRRS